MTHYAHRTTRARALALSLVGISLLVSLWSIWILCSAAAELVRTRLDAAAERAARTERLRNTIAEGGLAQKLWEVGGRAQAARYFHGSREETAKDAALRTIRDLLRAQGLSAEPALAAVQPQAPGLVHIAVTVKASPIQLEGLLRNVETTQPVLHPVKVAIASEPGDPELSVDLDLAAILWEE